MSEQYDYDRAIEYLTEHPEEIPIAWSNCGTHPAGRLFQMMTPSGGNNFRPDGKECGCATMLKPLPSGEVSRYVAWTDELTEAIRSDERIPGSSRDITPESLIAFKEIQERADREIRQPEATHAP